LLVKVEVIPQKKFYPNNRDSVDVMKTYNQLKFVMLPQQKVIWLRIDLNVDY